MTEVLYQGSNVPVRIGATHYVLRAQDFQITSRRTVEDVYQLGTVPPVGLAEDSWSYNATLTWNPIDVGTEWALANKSSGAVSFADIYATTGLTVTTPTRILTGVRCTALEYNINVPNGTWQATAELRATGYTRQDYDALIVQPAASGAASFRSKHVHVEFSEFGTTERLSRVRSIRARQQFNVTDWYELTNADPFYIQADQNSVSLTVEWYESIDDTAEGTEEFDYRPVVNVGDTAEVIEVQVGAGAWDAVGNVKYIWNGVQSNEGDNFQVRIGNPATIRMDFRAFDATNYGVVASVNT